MDYVLYHAGVKGMKWGVRKAFKNTSAAAKRTSRAISAANIEERMISVKRSIEKHDARSDRRKRNYKIKNAKYKAKLEKLKGMRDRKISDLSDYDIERGRSAYKTMKSTSMSVAITAASLAAGSVSVPASVATKLVGSGLAAVMNSADIDLDK